MFFKKLFSVSLVGITALTLMCGMAKSDATWASRLSGEDIAEMKTHYTYTVTSGGLVGYTIEIDSTTGRDLLVDARSKDFVEKDIVNSLWEVYSKKDNVKLTRTEFENQLALTRTATWNWE